jgi:hypothetical protein
MRLWARGRRRCERLALDESKLGERAIKLRNLAAPRRHDALEISRRACAS